MGSESVTRAHEGQAAWYIDEKAVVKGVFVTALVAEVLLVVLDLCLNYAQMISSTTLQHIFNLAREQSLGTWFAVVQAALTGMVLLALSASARIGGDVYLSNRWGVLAVFFLYISADDAAKIHERVGGYVDKSLSDAPVTEAFSWLDKLQHSFPSYPWQWVFAPFFLAMGFYLLLFLWRRLPSVSTKWQLLAAFTCWGVAVGIDFLEGIEGLFEILAESFDVTTYTLSHPILVLEEFLEMFGGTLFLCIFIRCLVRNFVLKQVVIGFVSK